MPPPSEAGPSSARAGKRKERTPPDDDTRPRKKANKTPPKPPEQQRKQARRDETRLTKKSGLTASEKSLQPAVNLHTQIMWGIYTSTDVPKPPSPAQVAAFQRRFATADQWDEFVSTQTYDDADTTAAISALRTSIQTRRRTPIINNILCVKEHHLTTIFSGIFSAGLLEWRPDVIGGTPDSLYNRAHELVAIRTFQVVATAMAYRRLSPDLTRVKDVPLLTRLFRHYIYSVVKPKILKESLMAGSVVAHAQRTDSYKRRSALGKARTKKVLGDGWTERVCALTSESFCNSDDEYDPADGFYIIKPKPVRSANATAWVRIVDQDRDVVAKSNGRVVERTRKIVADDQPSSITAHLPRRVPLDWFDPTEFNKLPAELRARYRESGIALPAAHHWVAGRVPDKFKIMNDATFMRIYGAEVMTWYQLPSDEEVEQMRENGTLNDDEAEAEDDQEDDEDGPGSGEDMDQSDG
ncbi:hypothetical protein B0H15DRAFT_961763 [Mycena belliarum]|uniref:Uncharacterized protein n=1 Tax=Mycena belliarum TaxID=1033014 RepID=A0AAD6TNW1_9AGAR|nr:hypothetical protein B0H15DRAFT_961763 [Mycena belliae]